MMKLTLRAGFLLLALSMAFSVGCEQITGKLKSAKDAFQDLKKIQAIAKVAVPPKEINPLIEKAQKSTAEAVAKLEDGDLKNALLAAIDGYVDARKIMEGPVQMNMRENPWGGYKLKYRLKLPDDFVPQFALLKPIFEVANKSVDRVGELLK